MLDPIVSRARYERVMQEIAEAVADGISLRQAITDEDATCILTHHEVSPLDDPACREAAAAGLWHRFAEAFREFALAVARADIDAALSAATAERVDPERDQYSPRESFTSQVFAAATAHLYARGLGDRMYRPDAEGGAP